MLPLPLLLQHSIPIRSKASSCINLLWNCYLLNILHLCSDSYWYLADNRDMCVPQLLRSGSLGWWRQSNILQTHQESLTSVTISPCDIVNSYLCLIEHSWAGLDYKSGKNVGDVKVTYGRTVQMDDESKVVAVPRKPFFSSVKEFLLIPTCITDGLMLTRVSVCVCMCVTMSPLL